jgi:hypothetical protein
MELFEADSVRALARGVMPPLPVEGEWSNDPASGPAHRGVIELQSGFESQRESSGAY